MFCKLAVYIFDDVIVNNGTLERIQSKEIGQ